MRLFLGFAPASAEREIYSVCQRLALGDELPLKWTPTENWHITLAFLGEVAERALARLDDAIAPVAANHPSMELSLTSVEWFPSFLKPRLLALRVEPSEALVSLQSDLAAALRRAGFHTENRQYRPHLTLARLKGSRRSFHPPALPPMTPLVLKTAELVLYESVTGGRHSRYRALQRFELAV